MSGAKALFVTATDTGAGKTFVACAIAAALRSRGREVGVMKPVATGCRRLPDGGLASGDAELLLAASGSDDPMALVTPVAFEPPLAPTAAARLTKAAFDRASILEAYGELRARHEVLIVEGIGGLLAPLEGRYTVRDLALDLGCPLLVVARDALGTISHTALTVESARRAGLEVRGIVLNRPPDVPPDLSADTNAEEIENLTGLRVWARLGPLEGFEAAARELDVRALEAIAGLAG